MKNTLPNQQTNPAPQKNRPSVTLATTFKKVSEMFDVHGNRIDPLTKQVIEKADK